VRNVGICFMYRTWRKIGVARLWWRVEQTPYQMSQEYGYGRTVRHTHTQRRRQIGQSELGIMTGSDVSYPVCCNSHLSLQAVQTRDAQNKIVTLPVTYGCHVVYFQMALILRTSIYVFNFSHLVQIFKMGKSKGSPCIDY
jgi:hypothetical protein